MQTEQAVLIPPSDEQAWPSFHVAGDLAPAFIDHLKARGITIQLPPEDIGEQSRENTSVVDIEVAEEHSLEELEGVLKEFLNLQHS